MLVLVSRPCAVMIGEEDQGGPTSHASHCKAVSKPPIPGSRRLFGSASWKPSEPFLGLAKRWRNFEIYIAGRVCVSCPGSRQAPGIRPWKIESARTPHRVAHTSTAVPEPPNVSGHHNETRTASDVRMALLSMYG